jgi:hypothetical protein
MCDKVTNNANIVPGIKKRLFVVSGPAQALNVMAIISKEQSSGKTNDFAIIGSIAVSNDSNSQIIETTMNILSGHDWEYIKDVTSIESSLTNHYANKRYNQCEEVITEAIGFKLADELYMINNSRHPLTIMLGRMHEQVRTVIYGDAFGIIDSSLGYGFSSINDVMFFLPIEYNKGLLNHIPYKIMSKEILLSEIDNMIERDVKVKTALSALYEKIDGNSVLLTTVQFSEWQMMDMSDEVYMYVKAVKRCCKPGCTIFIKEHPRATREDRAKLLKENLTALGFKCVVIDDEVLRFIPTEVICRRVLFSKIISTASTSGITAKYLYNSDIDFGVDLEDFNNFKRGKYLEIFVTGMSKALENLDTWDMDSPLFSYDVSPHNYLEASKQSAIEPILDTLPHGHELINLTPDSIIAKIPETIRINTLYKVKFILRVDTPETAHIINDHKNVNISYHWFNEDMSIYIWDNGRVAINPALSGNEFSSDIIIRTPEKPGIYHIQFDVVEESKQWFVSTGLLSSECMEVVVVF